MGYLTSLRKCITHRSALLSMILQWILYDLSIIKKEYRIILSPLKIILA